MIVIAINSSEIAPYVTHVDIKFAGIAGMVFFIAMTGYAVAWLIGRLMKRSQDEIVSLIYTGGMRAHAPCINQRHDFILAPLHQSSDQPSHGITRHGNKKYHACDARKFDIHVRDIRRDFRTVNGNDNHQTDF